VSEANPAVPVSEMTPAARLLFWDHERGSLAYDVLVVIILLVVFLVPDAVWNDPLRLPR
jgi:hypothetical protein